MQVEIIQLDDETEKFVVKGAFDHPYPTTKIIWAPAKAATQDDMFATTGDYLRLWKVGSDGVTLNCLLNNVSC